MSARKRSTDDCRALLLQVSRYLDGDLTPGRLRTMERHIKGCACCGTLAARLRKTLKACRAEGRRRPPRDVRSRAAARIRALIAREGQAPASSASPARARRAR